MTEVLVRNADEEARFFRRLKITEKPYRATVKKGCTRSLSQNAYLWGVVYPTLLTETGLTEQGWQKDDLHEYLLGECFGWNTLEGFGRKRLKPMNRSSNLSKMEFVDYVAFIQQFAAEHGVVIPDPDNA